MTPTPLAFSPGSATLIFLPCHGPTMADDFAKGAAVALEHGVTAAVRPAATTRVLFNGDELELPPVRAVIEQLAPEPVEVRLDTTLPLGCGFGVSAGCALTTTFALAKRFDWELTRHELGMIAHTAEVRSGTGIGDVATQLSGGIVYRRGVDGPFDCVQMKLDVSSLHYCSFGPISTKEILQDEQVQRVLAVEGERGVDYLKKHHHDLSLADLLDRSLHFAAMTGLLADEPVIRTIEQVRRNHGHATMVMLGQSVIATQPSGDDVEWRSCGVDPGGTRWL